MFPKTVRRDVIILLCVKALMLTLIYFLLVKPAMVPEPKPATMAEHLIGG
jgi:hypothetical protein